MPKDLPDGEYTLQAAMDTGSDLGFLIAKRRVTLGPDPWEIQDQRQKAYRKALKAGGSAAIAAARKALIESYKRVLSPGKAYVVDTRSHVSYNIGPMAGPDKFSGLVQFELDGSALALTADIVDAAFSPDAPAGEEVFNSSVKLSVCATGLREDICHFIFVPQSSSADAAVRAARRDGTAIEARQVTATWEKTSKGYTLTARLPWSCLPSFDSRDGCVMVDVSLNTRPEEGYANALMLSRSPSGGPICGDFARLAVP